MSRGFSVFTALPILLTSLLLSADRPVVYTTFYPTTYFIERIAGDAVHVICPLPDDADPIFWKPDRATICAYQEADLVVANGARFERWIDQVSLPRARFVDTARPFRDELVRFQGSTVHSHGRGGMHSHEGIDGHTWLDPVNARVQAGEILTALKKLLTDQEERLQDRFDALAADLEGLDQTFRGLSALVGEQTVLASHPAYNYVAKRNGWNVVSLDLDPEEEPGDEAVAKIATIVKDTGAHLILWEAEPLAVISERFERELGLESVEFSPVELLDAESRQAGADYLSVMRANLERLGRALGSD